MLISNAEYGSSYHAVVNFGVMSYGDMVKRFCCQKKGYHSNLKYHCAAGYGLAGTRRRDAGKARKKKKGRSFLAHPMTFKIRYDNHLNDYSSSAVAFTSQNV